MNQPSEKKPVSEFSKRETELTKRANEYLKELSKTQTMSYIDDDGYILLTVRQTEPSRAFQVRPSGSRWE